MRYRSDGSRTVITSFEPDQIVESVSVTLQRGEPAVYFDRGTCTDNETTASGFDILKIVDLPRPN